MRAVLLTNGGLNGMAVMQAILASPHIELCGLVISTRMFRKRQGFAAGAFERVRASGLRYAAYLWMATALADARLRLAASGSCGSRARRMGVPVHATSDVDASDSIAFLRLCAPDLIVSAFFNQRIGAAVVSLPRFGAVNIHPSPLPAGRGVDPVFFARLRGVPELGVTLHRVAPDLDAGPILGQERLAPPVGESVFATTARLYCRGAALLLEALDDLAAGKAGEPQAGDASYDSWPDRAQVAAMRACGVPLVRAVDLLRPSRIVESGRNPPPMTPPIR